MKIPTDSYKHKDLIKFGLNPFHWFISEWNKANPEIALFTHIDDPELKLKAILTKKNQTNEYRISELSYSY
jgi:hypothetical protein